MILVNINVVLDVVQRREPHYRASAAVLDQVLRKKVEGALSPWTSRFSELWRPENSGSLDWGKGCNMWLHPFGIVPVTGVTVAPL
ncbi:MAG: hypothetical protein WD057_10350 [Aquisalimonadaceae bacterium]